MDFNKNFGKKPFEELRAILPAFAVSALIFLILIIYLANLDINDARLEQSIRQQYTRLIVDFDFEPPKETRPVVTGLLSDIELPRAREEILKELKEDEILQENVAKEAAEYGDLPTIDISELHFEAQMEKDIDRAIASRSLLEKRVPNRERRYSEEGIDDLLRRPFEYKINRDAAMYVDVPDFMLHQEEKEIDGYRDLDEVMKVFYNRKNLFEFCYLKEARKRSVIPGYVKVEFKISPAGKVLPSSIRILDSTIRNRIVEQCLKKRLRRINEFAELNSNRGNARIVHKFVFN